MQGTSASTFMSAVGGSNLLSGSGLVKMGSAASQSILSGGDDGTSDTASSAAGEEQASLERHDSTTNQTATNNATSASIILADIPIEKVPPIPCCFFLILMS